MVVNREWLGSGEDAGGEILAPCLQLVEQGQSVLRGGIMAQCVQSREIVVEGERGQRAVSGQSRLAEAFPTSVFFRGQGLGPVARTIAEQQFGIARVAERKRSRAEFLRRRGAYLAEQALVGIGQEATPVERQLGIIRWRELGGALEYPAQFFRQPVDGAQGVAMNLTALHVQLQSIQIHA